MGKERSEVVGRRVLQSDEKRREEKQADGERGGWVGVREELCDGEGRGRGFEGDGRGDFVEHLENGVHSGEEVSFEPPHASAWEALHK